MVNQINTWIGACNRWSEIFWRFNWGMLIQVSILVLSLLCVDLLIKRRARAITRYCLWTLVLAKLLLPLHIGTPVSVGYWIAPVTATAAKSDANNNPVAIRHEEAAPTSIAMLHADVVRPPVATRPTAIPALPLPAGQRVASAPPAVQQVATQILIHLHWKAYVLLAWASVVAILMALIAWKALAIRRIVRSSRNATGKFRPMMAVGLKLLGMKQREVHVRVTERLSSPAICGFWKPTILLPYGLSERLDPDQLRLVFVHELAHWKRFDLQINCLQTFLQVVYFYNPAVWFANVMIRRLREAAVDETVLVATHSGPQQYGNTLLDVAAAELRPAELTLRLIGVVESRRQLTARIKRIIGFPVPKTAKLGVATVVAVAFAGLLLLPMAGKSSKAAPQANAAVSQAAVSKSADNSASSAPAAKPVPAMAKPNLSGRLVDETGAPVTDARIELTYLRNYHTQRTKSDQNGNYEFVGTDGAGTYEIEIHSNRWVGIVDRKALPRVDLRPGTQVVRDFTLPRACQLNVHVVDAQDRPLDGVEVLSSLATDNQNFASRATTDRDGWATLTGLRPSSQERLVATMGGGKSAFTRTTLRLTDPSKVIQQKIILPAGGKVTGKAICSDGKPAAGWRISAIPTWWQFGTSPSGQVIAKDGTFSLPNIAPDSYNLNVSIPTGPQMSMVKPVLADTHLPAGKPLAITVDYPSPSSLTSLSGHIEYVGGKLERGMHIFARSANNTHSGDGYVEPGQQDFVLGPLPPGMYTIDFDSTEIEPLTLRDVQVPSNKKLSVRVKIRAAITLQGVVVRASDSKPVTRYRSQIAKIRTLKGPNYVQDASWHNVNDPRGAFKFDVNGPGIYVVQIMADGFGLAASQPFNTETEGSKLMRIELATSKPLVGTVVDEQGNPVDDAKVIPLPSAGIIHGQVAGQLSPGEPIVATHDGKFTLPQLPPNRGVIKVVHPDFAPTLLDANASEGKHNDKILRVVLHPGATVKGRVYDADGQPQANVALRFQDRDGYGGFDDEKLGQLARVTSDADGYYEADHLPAQYCYVQRDNPWKSWGTVRQAILTENDKTQTLDFGGTTKLTGRLTVNGKPLADARVQLSGESPFFGIFKAFAKSDENGAFTFWGTPSGKRTLYYTTDPQGQSWVHVKDVEVRQGDADLGDIECVSAKLTVRIDPAAGASIEGGSLHLQAFNPIWPFGNDTGKLEDRDNPNAPYVFDQVPPGQYELVYYRPGQFTVRQRVDISPSAREKSVPVKVPSATASLTGTIAPAICSPDGCRALNVWSNDQHLAGAIIPKENGTYQLDNIPAGEYLIRDKDTRDATPLLRVGLRDGEHKTLNITPENVVETTKPIGFAVVDVFTTDGVPLPGCKFQFDVAANAPSLSSSQNAHMDFIGEPGVHDVTIEYPGFKPQRLKLDLKLVGKGGRAIGDVQNRVYLESIKR